MRKLILFAAFAVGVYACASSKPSAPPPATPSA
jgi:hypothetical protein